MKSALQILDENHEKVAGYLIGIICDHQRWSPEAYWLIDKALYELETDALTDCETFRKAVREAAFTYTHLLLSFSWHFDPDDDWEYENLSSDEIYHWRERVQVTFEGFLTGAMPANGAAQLENPLLS